MVLPISPGTSMVATLFLFAVGIQEYGNAGQEWEHLLRNWEPYDATDEKKKTGPQSHRHFSTGHKEVQKNRVQTSPHTTTSRMAPKRVPGMP